MKEEIIKKSWNTPAFTALDVNEGTENSVGGSIDDALDNS